MSSFTTFYLSRVIGKKVFDANGKIIGIVKDLLVDSDSTNQTFGRPLVNGIKIKFHKQIMFYSFQDFCIEKVKGRINVSCKQPTQLSDYNIHNNLYLAESVLDKQIVDINGHKLVRVNDIRLVSIVDGTFSVAVDIGIEGLLRRIGIAKPLKFLLSIFKINIPAKLFLWEFIETIDSSNQNIKL